MSPPKFFFPSEAAMGGATIGFAVGMYMLTVQKVAGMSGCIKRTLLDFRDTEAQRFVLGLIIGGIITSSVIPWSYETFAPLDTENFFKYAIGGFSMGVGTSLQNGCTSGHGLAGCARLSRRSLIAVPIFMLSAALTASAFAKFHCGNIVLPEQAPSERKESGKLLLSLLLLWAPVVSKSPLSEGKRLYISLIVGITFASGLAIGGMVRPSTVIDALSPSSFNLTLWVLFMTALVVSFAIFHIARKNGVSEAAYALNSGPIDFRLVSGAVLFGAGWGATGLCPGPMFVAVVADPTAGGPSLCALFLLIGMHVESRLRAQKGEGLEATINPRVGISNLSRLGISSVEKNLFLDVRSADGNEADEKGRYSSIVGALSAPWKNDALPISTVSAALKGKDRAIIFCKSGRRAGKAREYLVSKGLLPDNMEVVCCSMNDLKDAAPTKYVHTHDCFRDTSGGVIFKQLFDPETSTYTYIIGDAKTREAIIIDPVKGYENRDVEEAARMGLHLILGVNTHCHADHVTGTGRLKELIGPAFQSAISDASGARADIKLQPNQQLRFGDRILTVLQTPGHTDGCVSYYDADMGAVFTGDALLIGGCGRTDFQQGDSRKLYASVHEQLFSLPEKTLVYPAHDYRGRLVSTVGEEKRNNPRLGTGKSEDDFVLIMSELKLSPPKHIDVAVPANMVCGV